MADVDEGKIYMSDEVLNLSDSEMYFRFCSAESIPSKTSHYRLVKYKCYLFPTPVGLLPHMKSQNVGFLAKESKPGNEKTHGFPQDIVEKESSTY